MISMYLVLIKFSNLDIVFILFISLFTLLLSIYCRVYIVKKNSYIKNVYVNENEKRKKSWGKR